MFLKYIFSLPVLAEAGHQVKRGLLPRKWQVSGFKPYTYIYIYLFITRPFWRKTNNTYTYTYIYIYMCVCVCVCIGIYIYIYIYAEFHVHISCLTTRCNKQIQESAYCVLPAATSSKCKDKAKQKQWKIRNKAPRYQFPFFMCLNIVHLIIMFHCFFFNID